MFQNYLEGWWKHRLLSPSQCFFLSRSGLESKHLHFALIFIYMAALGLSCSRVIAAALGIWFTLPGFEPRSSPLGGQSLSHGTTRDVPRICIFNKFSRDADASGPQTALHFEKHLFITYVCLSSLGSLKADYSWIWKTKVLITTWQLLLVGCFQYSLET